MSNALAIATVTTALAQVVRTAAQSVVNGADVLTGRPDPAASPAHRIHLFLYQVLPNIALRNSDLPMRSSNGKTITRPTAALDLHYLLAFYGSETELEAQRMLGAVVRDLHSRPVLTRSMIQASIASQPFLNGSNLADAVEQVKFTPLSVTVEEMSKIWSIFYQIPYALSIAYQGSVVLIESDESVQSAFPVLKRGDTDKGVNTLLGPFPLIESVYFGLPTDAILQSRPLSLPAAQLGLCVIVMGHNVSGEDVSLTFNHSKLELSQDLPVDQSDLSATELKVTLPQPDSGTSQTDWAPGVYTITVVQKSSGNALDITSNTIPIALSPIIGAIEPGTTIARDAQGTATITITCRPRVRSEQQVHLLLAGMEIVGQIDGGNPDKVNFAIENAPAVSGALIRLRVDGIESMPFNRVDVPPPPRFEFDANQRVTIT